MTSTKRLAAVLRIRQIQERGARGELANERRRHRLAAAAEQATWRALDEGESGAVGATVSATGAEGITGRRLVVDVGVRAASNQHEATTAAAAAVANARDRWTAAARRVEGMQRLADRLGASEHDEHQRLAANEIDDLVLARFGRHGSRINP